MRIRSAVGMLALAIALALAGVAAAGHQEATQTRRTVSCSTEEDALQLWAFATNPSIGSAGVTISTGNPNHVIGPRLPARSSTGAALRGDADELDRLGAPRVGARDEGALQPHVALRRLEPDG